MEHQRGEKWWVSKLVSPIPSGLKNQLIHCASDNDTDKNQTACGTLSPNPYWLASWSHSLPFQDLTKAMHMKMKGTRAEKTIHAAENDDGLQNIILDRE